jgi:hypothetical protein
MKEGLGAGDKVSKSDLKRKEFSGKIAKRRGRRGVCGTRQQGVGGGRRVGG